MFRKVLAVALRNYKHYFIELKLDKPLKVQSMLENYIITGEQGGWICIRKHWAWAKLK